MNSLTPVQLTRTLNIEETKIKSKFLLPPKLTKNVYFRDDKYKEYIRESLSSPIFLSEKWNKLRVN